jgi:hypothetical protein
VTVQILKPTDARQYTDTVGMDCRFEAEWLRSTGLFSGETLAGEPCFQPNKAVSRGEFLTMLVKTLQIPTEEDAAATQTDAPQWLQPYLAAALRSGLITQIPSQESGSFDTAQPITGAEAAVMLQNAMDLAVSTCTMEGAPEEGALAWAAVAVATMAENGIQLSPESTLTRGQVAQILYQASQMAQDAPGLQMYQ